VFRSELGDDASWNLVTVCGGDNSCHNAIHGEVKGYFIIILPASGDPDDEIDADEGLKFLKCGTIRKRVKLKAKK
jgi:hypothetical protein